MQRISGATVAADLFGPGKDGFTEGNPVTGESGTIVNGDWLNGAQEEICRAIEAGGGTLDGSQYNQLATVLRLGQWTIAATGSYTLPGGLIIKWGSASIAGGGSVSVEFADPFPIEVFQIFCGPYITGPQTEPIAYAATVRDRTYFDMRNLSTSPLNAGWWVALGR